MIKEIYGDVISEGVNAHGMICHQVNYEGVMGAGVAYQIRERLLGGGHYDAYKQVCARYEDRTLGNVFYSNCDNSVIVANMFCQDGFSKGGSCATDYEAMRRCMEEIREVAEPEGIPIFFPGRIGCGLAGGDWDKVRGMIYEIFKDCTVPVTIVYWRDASNDDR